jgi:phage baseplate assembly protein W
MLPANNNLIDTDDVVVEVPSKTFFIDFNNNKIVGTVDGIDAVKQAVFLILNTERYENMVYDWDYGFETQDLIGMPIGYVYPELKRRIEEALMQDDRIESVDSFNFEKQSSAVTVSFTVTSTLGIFETETEVNI